MAEDDCLNAHVFYTVPYGWALCVQVPGADPAMDNESWGEHIPTPAERRGALKAMGFAPVTAWVWRESPAHEDQHSLYAVTHVRRTAQAATEPKPEAVSA